MITMSVHEILSSSKDRPDGFIDYVDENGDVQVGSEGDDAMDRPATEHLLRVAQLADVVSEHDRLMQDIDNYADKRGISIYDSALAFGVDLHTMESESEVLTDAPKRAVAVSAKPSKKKISTRRPRPNALSGRDAERLIGLAQDKAEKDLGRRLTDEEMMAVAGDVEREYRWGSSR